jgi:ABC-type Mn2+/Zn2+ transport system ATPase subunit
MRALDVKDLTVRFGGQDRAAVEEVSFGLDEGQIAILIGPNGSGKSTVLKAILGRVPLTGQVRVFGLPARRGGGRWATSRSESRSISACR